MAMENMNDVQNIEVASEGKQYIVVKIGTEQYGIDISVMPNSKQIPVLQKFINSLNGEFTVDFSDEKGYSKGSIDYPEGTNSARIINDIKRFFETGVVPEQSTTASFHTMYQDRTTNDAINQSMTITNFIYGFDTVDNICSAV